jgi:hypothetical protein
MVDNNQVRCHACENVLVIRVVVAGGLQRFVFPCPYCTTQLMGSFYAEQPTGPLDAEEPLKAFEIKSEDFDVLEYDNALESSELLAVGITTELPIHVSLLSEPFTERTPSPFLSLIQLAGFSDKAVSAVERINLLRQLRYGSLPAIRRAAVFYGQGDMEKIARELQKIPGYADSGLSDEDPWRGVTTLLRRFLAVLEVDGRCQEAIEEFGGVAGAALAADSEAARNLIDHYNVRALPEHRRATLDTLLRCLEGSDALAPGLWLEALPDLDLAEYRIQRADYDDVKTRYQEIFELASRTIVLPAMLSNIARREDPRDFADGARRPLRDALQAKSSIREGWLEELPATKELYGTTARRTRNLIGHRLVSFDFAKASLVDDRGREYSYLSFLSDYLRLVRLFPYLLELLAFLTDIEQLGPSSRT